MSAKSGQERRGWSVSRWMPAICWPWRWGALSIACPTTGPRCVWSSARSGSLRSIAAGGFRRRWSSRRATEGWVHRGSWRRAVPARWNTSLIERYCLFSTNRAGQPIRANLHHSSWPLEEAEAEIEQNDLAEVLGLRLPNRGAGAALLAPVGGLCVARGAGAVGAGGAARDGGGYALGIKTTHSG